MITSYFFYGGIGECRADGKIFSVNTEEVLRVTLAKGQGAIFKCPAEMQPGLINLHSHILGETNELRNRVHKASQLPFTLLSANTQDLFLSHS